MSFSFLTNEITSNLYPILFKLLEQNISKVSSKKVENEVKSQVGDPYQQVSGEVTPPLENSYGNKSRSGNTPSNYNFSNLVLRAAEKHNLDPNLVRAVIKAESNFNPSVVSKAGAMGLMQLMPGTAKSLGVKDAFNPEDNINGGTLFLSKLLTRYSGNIEKTLAAYNAGPGAVDRYGGIPPYRETQVYVNRVLNLYKSYNQEG